MDSNGNAIHFPLFIDLSAKRVTVVGGGSIAARRIGVLKRFTENIFVVAPKISGEITSTPHIKWEARTFEDRDIQGAYMVLAATDNPSLNHRIFQLCRENGILVNVCDNKNECDFFFPAIFENSAVIGGLVSKGGNDHKIVKETAKDIRDFLSKEKTL